MLADTRQRERMICAATPQPHPGPATSDRAVVHPAGLARRRRAWRKGYEQRQARGWWWQRLWLRLMLVVVMVLYLGSIMMMQQAGSAWLFIWWCGMMLAVMVLAWRTIKKWWFAREHSVAILARGTQGNEQA